MYSVHIVFMFALLQKMRTKHNYLLKNVRSLVLTK